ncbi:DUF1491 family protein [Azospirillum thermophilum]|uniref:DUF1491 domain-containing protein n=1 Tax=Azospirillum thermophilum TaxID=2202148 RepID=A0A2S2CWC1_9PROT|nr:DUF1491 family protein [Azospirillum thermophilum]AWK88700.1 DUF1491 domain-containing protein [Azospirillum thermophilum]
MDDRLPTHLWVMAHIRAADAQGVSMMVVRKGDPGRGTVILKLNRLDGRFSVLVQIREGERLAWSRGTGADPVTEAEADAYIARQTRYDPDVWVIEVEDRQGRPWFEGPIR